MIESVAIYMIDHDGYYENLYWNFLAWTGQFQVVDIETLFLHESVFTSNFIS